MKQESERYASLLGSCFIALKNITLYPPGHSQLNQCVAQAYGAIEKELEKQTPLSFGVAKEVLIYGDEPISSGGQSLTNFAKRLSSHDIATFTFHKGLDKESLVLFFQLLAKTPEEAAGEDGIAQELIKLGGKNIDLLGIDYNLFQLSHKNGLKPEDWAGIKQQQQDIWIEFTKLLLQDCLASDGEGGAEGASSHESAVGDPVTLARFINENNLNVDSSLEHFGEMLDGILGSVVADNSPSSGASGPMSVEDFSMVGSLLTELSPSLRKQFLSRTLDKCQENLNTNTPSKLLSSLSEELVSDMLEIVKEADREISPSLLLLIEGLSFGQAATITDKHQELSAQNIDVLLAKEKYAEYVEQDYAELLQVLGQNQQTIEPPVGFVLADHEPSFEKVFLVERMARLLLVLMGETVVEEEYSMYGEKLIEIAFELPSLGDYSLDNTLIETLTLHSETHQSHTIRRVAKDYLTKIAGREYVETLATLISTAEGKEKEKALQALMARGRPAVAELLDLYCEETSVAYKGELEAFFTSYRVDTLAEIIRRIKGGKTKRILILLALTKMLGLGSSAAVMFRPLLYHQDEAVRLETFSLLLPVEDSEANEVLAGMLASSDEHVMASGMALAWKCKTKVLVPDLLALLSYRCLRKKDIDRNNRIILALSGIADPLAIPSLEKLAGSKMLLHSAEVAKMKRGLFLSLSAYQPESVVSLCRGGVKSKEPEIRKSCRAILSRVKKGQKV